MAVRREFSAGGVLVRRLCGEWMLAAVRPLRAKASGNLGAAEGALDAGERAEEAALREVAEETGAHGRTRAARRDVEYWFTWRGERVAKVVRSSSSAYDGRAGSSGSRREVPHEVAEARWLPLDGRPRPRSPAAAERRHRRERRAAGSSDEDV